MTTRPALCLCVFALAPTLVSCDNGSNPPAPGGAAANVADAPKSILGKAVKSGKDTREAISRGGDSREAAVMNAKIRLDQLQEAVEAMKGGRQSEAFTTLIAAAESRIEKARSLAEKAESSTAADDGKEVKMIRDAVKEAEDAVASAKEKR
jgi:hypothetical protein